MASQRSLGVLSIDLVAKIAGFEQGMNKAERELDKRAKRMNAVAKKIGAGIGVAISAGIAASAALATGIKVSIDRMDELSKAAQRASLPTEQFTKLAYAGDLADVSMEELTKSLGKLAKAQGDAQAGLKTQKQAFEQLGIAYSNANGSLRSTHEVFLDFADAFQKYKGSPEVVAAGMQIFGRSFQTLIPLLKDGRAGLESAADEADRLGITLSTQAGQNAEAFNDNLTRLNTAVKGLWQTLASDLLPYLVELTDKFVEGIKEGGDLRAVAQNLATAIEGVGRAAESAIGPLARYYDWLQKTGRVEGNTADELEARRDALVENRKSFFAELTGSTGEIDREIARIDAKIAKLNSPFANVRGGSSSTYDIPNRPDPILPPGPTGGRSKGLADAEKAARAAARAIRELADADAELYAASLKVVDSQSRAMVQWVDITAQLDGPLKVAEVDHIRRLQEIEQVGKEAGATAEAIAAAKAKETDAYNATTEAIRAQAEAMANEDLIRGMDSFRSIAYDFLVDLPSKGKGAWRDFLDDLTAQLNRWAANGVIDQLFGKQGTTGQGTAGGGWLSALFGSSGSSQGSIMDLFSGSWGFAGGGTMPAYSAARVNELGMEMATVGGNDYLLTGAKPAEITPHHKLNRGAVVSNNTFYLAAPERAETQQQIANRTARELQLAQARR